MYGRDDQEQPDPTAPGDWWTQNAPPATTPYDPWTDPAHQIAATPGSPNYKTVPGWMNPNTAPLPGHPAYAAWLAANPPGAGGKPTGSAQDFIKTWQASHPVSEGMAPLLAAMKAAGYNVSPFMYGQTASNNEITVDGVKTKLIAAEGTAGANWFAAGTDDGGGSRAASANPFSTSMMSAANFGSTPTPYASEAWTGGDFKDPTMAEVQAMPGYQTRLDAGLLATNRSAAANGTILNGGTQKALTRYGQDYGENAFQTARGNAFQSYATRYGQFQDNNQRKLGDYTVNTANKRNSENDYWSRLRDLYSTGASTAAGSYKPG